MFSFLRGISGRLFLLTTITLASQIVCASIIYYFDGKVTENTEAVVENAFPMRLASAQMRADEMATLRYTWRGIVDTDAERSKKSLGLAAQSWKAFGERRASLEKLELSAEAQQASKLLDGTYPKLAKLFETVWELAEKSTEDARREAIGLMLTDMIPLAAEVDANLAVFKEASEKSLNASLALMREFDKKSDFASLVVPCTSIVVCLLLAGLQAHLIRRRLRELSDSLSSVGDNVEHSATALSAESTNLSEGATENAASLEETVSSLEELSSMVQANAANAKQADSLAQTARDGAEGGSRELAALMSAMGEIAAQSKKIEEIISVIDAIAFQTNLLALNAAVEAARAGEQGKGFAVVADAVRNLAQKSADAAKDISGLIKESVSRSDAGVQQAQRTAATLTRIVSDVKKVSDLVSEISSASSEQAQGVGQISKAMNQLDAVTQRNAAGAEETAASSTELLDQATQMHSLIVDLNLYVEGAGRSTQNARDVPPKSGSHRDTPKGHAGGGKSPTRGKTSTAKAGRTMGPAARSNAPTSGQHSVASRQRSAQYASGAAAVIPFDSDEPGESLQSEPTLGRVSNF